MHRKSNILITTAPKEVLIDREGLNNHVADRTDTYQVWTQAIREKYQIRIGCPPVGLRFLKENVPHLDILEYPSWEEYQKTLQNGYDIVGISYFTCSFGAVPEMVRMARQAGVKEVWAGNYGVFTPGTQDLFDKVVIGSGEKMLYEWFEGKPLDKIKHPAIISDLSYRHFSSKVGYLYTKRGCRMGCSFCSTPLFLPDEAPISMDEIVNVLDIYRQNGVVNVVIYDETFMTDEKTSLDVARALAERELPWVCLTRADRIQDKIPQLADLYMEGAIIGVESFREHNLKTIEKRQRARNIERTINEMIRHNLRTVGTYMICYPEDTIESIMRDIERLSSLGLFLAQISILTPFPATPLWKQLEDQITDEDWNHYDIYHLVWKHPCITPEEARELLTHGQTKINNPLYYSRKLRPRQMKQKQAAVAETTA
jgi:radical SAM superfamily enzyme YgiQ (UPF0313 family)